MKILMFTLLSACDLSFWHMLLGMIIPFLLGLLLGWFLWSRYKSLVSELEAKLATANKRIDELTQMNSRLEARVKELEGEILVANNKNKTISSELSVSRNAQSKLESELQSAKVTHTAFVAKAGDWENDAKKAKKELEEAQKDLDQAKKRIKDLEDRAQNALKATGGLSAAPKGVVGIAGLTKDITTDKEDSDVPKNEMNLRDYDDEDGKSDKPSGLKTGALGGVKGGTQGIAPSDDGDDLTKIEGIGPKIAAIFNDDGIYTWQQLSEKQPIELKAILDKAGPRYQMHDPGTWPKQAKMLLTGDQEKINAYQDYLIGGRDPKSILKDLADKLPDLSAGAEVFGHTIEMDDLKIIEGIGPAIESLFHEHDIKTWAALASSKVSRLQEILDGEGMRFKTAVPNTWPKQATLAQSGKWSQLKELQDRLDGGKE